MTGVIDRSGHVAGAQQVQINKARRILKRIGLVRGAGAAETGYSPVIVDAKTSACAAGSRQGTQIGNGLIVCRAIIIKESMRNARRELQGSRDLTLVVDAIRNAGGVRNQLQLLALGVTGVKERLRAAVIRRPVVAVTDHLAQVVYAPRVTGVAPRQHAQIDDGVGRLLVDLQNEVCEHRVLRVIDGEDHIGRADGILQRRNHQFKDTVGASVVGQQRGRRDWIH